MKIFFSLCFLISSRSQLLTDPNLMQLWTVETLPLNFRVYYEQIRLASMPTSNPVGFGTISGNSTCQIAVIESALAVIEASPCSRCFSAFLPQALLKISNSTNSPKSWQVQRTAALTTLRETYLRRQKDPLRSSLANYSPLPIYWHGVIGPPMVNASLDCLCIPNDPGSDNIWAAPYPIAGPRCTSMLTHFSA